MDIEWKTKEGANYKPSSDISSMPSSHLANQVPFRWHNPAAVPRIFKISILHDGKDPKHELFVHSQADAHGTSAVCLVPPKTLRYPILVWLISHAPNCHVQALGCLFPS
jgi:hypothetical protein